MQAMNSSYNDDSRAVVVVATSVEPVGAKVPMAPASELIAAVVVVVVAVVAVWSVEHHSSYCCCAYLIHLFGTMNCLKWQD